MICGCAFCRRRPAVASRAGRVGGRGGTWYVADMSKTHKCPLCSNEVDGAATVCSNKSCRADLAFCSHCRDVSTFGLADNRPGKTRRQLYRCDRCQRLGVKCYTWLSGGYCNGLARAGSHVDMPLCAGCSSRAAEVSRSVISWTIIGAVSGLVRRK